MADPGTTEHGGFAQGVCVYACAAGDKARIKNRLEAVIADRS